ncbi:cytochrome b561 [Phanerochaete sordida]|uniref:Cytochrome b561 n=1 Tax=Phanerochaete sordida TaxID=48140 RepID=A0A9P3G2A3_9APHY|nr:cytochrome b561 [Phanerochaete sordida]
MLSHLQDKWLPQGKSVLDSLLHPKFFDAAQALSQEEPETVALAAHDELQQGETEEMGFQEQVQATEVREGDGFASAVALVSAAVFLVVTWIATFASGTSFYWFGWHPLFQSLSILCFTYGIVTLQPTAHPKTKAAGLTRHQLAMIVIGFPVAFLGYLAIFVNKLNSNHSHFTSWHGFFGLVTFLCMVIQIAVGGGSVWFNGALFGGNPKAKLVWKYHRAVGYVSFSFCLLTAHLGGAWSNWAMNNTWWVVRALVYTFAPAAILAAVFARVRLSKMTFW